MFDIKTGPKIAIREGLINNVEIVKNGSAYRLLIDNQQWMFIDTKSSIQIREFYSSYDLVSGNVLLSGFGFGILPQWIATKDSVKSVTVVEWREEVIDLFLRNNALNSKIDIKIADILDYQDDVSYDWTILDHYELDRQPQKNEINKISSNVNFNNLWFWSVEYALLNYKNWSKFRDDYGHKIPDLSIDRIKHYLDNMFIQKDFQIHQ